MARKKKRQQKKNRKKAGGRTAQRGRPAKPPTPPSLGSQLVWRTVLFVVGAIPAGLFYALFCGAMGAQYWSLRAFLILAAIFGAGLAIVGDKLLAGLEGHSLFRR